MRSNWLRFISWAGALALVLTVVPGALAQCGSAKRPVKPAVWHPHAGGAQKLLVRGVPNDDDDGEASIVGMWHVTFTADTMNGSPFSAVLDNAVVVWHSDGTEIMNSSRPAQDGNFCMGVGTRTGKSKYLLNHIAWQGNDPENAPSGIGNPQEIFRLRIADRKMELDDSLSAAHYTLAMNRLAATWDWLGAEVEARRAIEVNPSNASAHWWYSDLLIFQGRMTEAEAEIQRAQELNPFSVEIYVAATARLYYERRYDEFIERCQEWVQRDPSLEWNYHHGLGRVRADGQA